MIYRLIVPLDSNHGSDGDYDNPAFVMAAIEQLLMDDAVPTFILVKLGERDERK